MRLVSSDTHPHGLTDNEYDALFTKDKPIIFAFHGYANLIHELTYKRHNHNLHVHGYMEEGAITTAFDMRVINEIDRFHLVKLALKHLNLNTVASRDLERYCDDLLGKHKVYIKEYGVDMPIVANWTFKGDKDV